MRYMALILIALTGLVLSGGAKGEDLETCRLHCGENRFDCTNAAARACKGDRTCDYQTRKATCDEIHALCLKNCALNSPKP